MSADFLFPNDSRFDSWDENNPEGNNWGQEFVKLPSAWAITTGNKATKIAIIDFGFDIKHEDLIENIVVVGPGNLTHEHGTAVAGIFTAKGNNEKGIAGTMWDSDAQLYSVGTYGQENISVLLATLAMKLAISRNAKIINYSAAQTYKTISNAQEEVDFWKKSLFDWVEQNNKDVVFVFPAGNEGENVKSTSPTKLSEEYPYVISVAANDEEGNLANPLIGPSSNYGKVSVAAPGIHIFSTLPNNKYDYYGFGAATSFSAPFVSGLAGLIYSVDPSRYEGKYKGKVLTAKDAKDLIVQGAINGGKYVSGLDGRQIPIINAHESLKILVEAPLPPSPPSLTWKASQPIVDCEGPIDNQGIPWFELTFDDSGWQNISLPDFNTWGCDFCDRYYRGYLTLSQNFGKITISFASDDGLWFYINGNFINHWGGACHESGCVNNPYRCGVSTGVDPLDITSFLHGGTNLIAVHVSDAGADDIFNFNLVNPLAPAGTSIQIQLDDSLRLYFNSQP